MLTVLAITVFLTANATCPEEITITDALTCSSDYSGTVPAAEVSYLGGDCAEDECYTCGKPEANEAQVSPENVFSFECQQDGSIEMILEDLTCDLDIYVLDGTCDPSTGCMMGSTAPDAVDEVIEFPCVQGELYYVVVEATGTRNPDRASGLCTEDGTANGAVYDPGFTLNIDVEASTGCAEDCDDGIDNDLDGAVDCDDSDCGLEELCCDADGDGYRAEGACGGDDCDDSAPGVNPGERDIPDNDIDEDCDGFDETDSSCIYDGAYDSDPPQADTDDGQGSTKALSCNAVPIGVGGGALLGLMALGLVARRR